MPLWLACVLLVLDLAALVYFRRHLRQKKTMRVIATCVCGLLAALLLLYLALAAMLLFAASKTEHKNRPPVMCCNRRAILSVRKA